MKTVYFEINKSSFDNEFKLFSSVLKKKKIDFLTKDYFYVNIWSMSCAPCVNEIKIINTMAASLGNFTSILISNHSNNAVDNFLKKQNFVYENLLFINEMNNFMSGIYNEIELKEPIYPLHIILNKRGNFLAYLIGAFEKEEDTSQLTNFIKTLK